MLFKQPNILEAIPLDVLKIILGLLKGHDLVTFCRMSKKAKELGTVPLSNLLKETIAELKTYNPHDLYYTAENSQGLAILIVSVPELAKIISNRIFGGHYADERLDISYKNKIYGQNSELYLEDIIDPLLELARKYANVAEIILKDNYPFKIDQEDREELTTIVLANSKRKR